SVWKMSNSDDLNVDAHRRSWRRRSDEASRDGRDRFRMTRNRNRNVPAASELAGRWVESLPTRPRQIHFGPGVGRRVARLGRRRLADGEARDPDSQRCLIVDIEKLFERQQVDTLLGAVHEWIVDRVILNQEVEWRFFVMLDDDFTRDGEAIGALRESRYGHRIIEHVTMPLDGGHRRDIEPR